MFVYYFNFIIYNIFIDCYTHFTHLTYTHFTHPYTHFTQGVYLFYTPNNIKIPKMLCCLKNNI